MAAPAEPQPSVRILDGWASGAMGLSWLAALFYVLAFLPTIREWTVGNPLTSVDIVGWQLVLAAGYLVLYLAAAVTFVTWLFLARRNVTAFPEASPAWGEPWSVTVWCLPAVVVAGIISALLFVPDLIPLSGAWLYVLPYLPLLSLAVGAAVIADVVRNSGDGSSTLERQRYAVKAWGWWLFCLAALAVPEAGLLWTLRSGFAGWEIADTGIFVTPPGVAMTVGCVFAFLAVLRLTSVISWVSAEHRQRVERRWDGGLGQRAAAGFDAA